jgi:hypothetical protein
MHHPIHIPHAQGIGNGRICCGATPGSLQDGFWNLSVLRTGTRTKNNPFAIEL